MANYAKPRGNKEPLLPELTNPQTQRAEAFRIRFEREEIPEDTDLSTAIRGVSKVEESINSVNNVRDKLMKDPTLNKAGKRSEYLRYVKRKGNEIHQNIENVTKIIDRRTQEISDIVNQPIKQEADTNISNSIREYVAKLPSKADRMAFIKKKIDEGCILTASSCLGSLGYLAGIDDNETQQTLLTYYRKKRFSDLMKVQESLNKIGESMLNRTVIVSNFRKKIETSDSLSALESRRAREEATS